MAALQASSSVLRTRSTRVTANSGRSLHPAARSASVSNPTSTTIVASPTSQATSTVSNVSLFLTNLRLLDLDLQPDRPDINALTFTTKDLAQGQKKRIQCVEWALYQLFTLWVPEEARHKLQPFFPPLDQVQSLNLRAALLRSLEHAKKNGFLGRDAVVRKTMLDECKGERLEEVLAVFSSAVLRKVVAEQLLNGPRRHHHDHPALAQTLALENRGYSSERTQLGVLILVHKASLSWLLREKRLARTRFADFAELLGAKERGLIRRREQLRIAEAERHTEAREVSSDFKLDVWRTVRNNWAGNEHWMETLLYGDTHIQKDGLLSAPFDRVWRRVQLGRLSELEDRSDGLLKQLQGRVQAQKERLGKWKDFQERVLGKGAVADQLQAKTEGEPNRNRQKGIDFGFGAHENLRFGRLSPRKLPRMATAKTSANYDELVRGLEKELASIRRTPSRTVFSPRTSGKLVRRPDEMYLGIGNQEDGVISELSELEDDSPSSDNALFKGEGKTTKLLEPSFEPIPRKSTLEAEGLHHYRRDSEIVHPQRISTKQVKPGLLARRQTNPSPPDSPERCQSTPPPLTTPHRSRSPDQLSRAASPERPESPTQQLADQILASMNAASPSPAKRPRHTLSLAERTRLSMMSRRGSHVFRDDHAQENDEADIDVLPLRRLPTVTVEGAEPTQHTEQHNGILINEGDDVHEDLTTRTRRSMVGFEAARQKAQLERRRSQRKSRQTMTPGAGARREDSSCFPVLDEEDNSTLLLAEELMSGEQDDYEAVFMSRPKIKTSPIGTPVKGATGD